MTEMDTADGVLYVASSPQVRDDDRGATVCEVRPGIYEVLCVSHATTALSPDRDRLEQRAKKHNENWHPWLAKKSSGSGVAPEKSVLP